jgi:hypothetical protein
MHSVFHDLFSALCVSYASQYLKSEYGKSSPHLSITILHDYCKPFYHFFIMNKVNKIIQLKKSRIDFLQATGSSKGTR